MENKIVVKKVLGYGLIGEWEGDNLPIEEIPATDIHEFWGTYAYTHGGNEWKKACEVVSEMKQKGHEFLEGEIIKF